MSMYVFAQCVYTECLSKLLTICFIYFFKEMLAIFPAFSNMLLLGMSFQQIINNNLMKEV